MNDKLLILINVFTLEPDRRTNWSSYLAERPRSRRDGYVSQLELLDAQRSELSNRREALQVRAAHYQATIGLIKALGGG